MTLSPAVAAPLKLDLSLTETEIKDRCFTSLLNVHAVDLPRHIDHVADDVDLIWQADGTAVLNLRLWASKEPPFPHAAIIVVLAFDAGRVGDIESVQRKSFGA